MMRRKVFIFGTGMTFLSVFLFALLLAGCGGPHSSPEKVAKAYVDALPSGDCQKISEFFDPTQQQAEYWHCMNPILKTSKVTKIQINEIIGTRQDRFGNTLVVMTGEFYREVNSMGWKKEKCTTVTIPTIQIGNKWYITPDPVDPFSSCQFQ